MDQAKVMPGLFAYSPKLIFGDLIDLFWLIKMPTNFFDVIADIKVNIDGSVDNSLTTVFS